MSEGCSLLLHLFISTKQFRKISNNENMAFLKIGNIHTEMFFFFFEATVKNEASGNNKS